MKKILWIGLVLVALAVSSCTTKAASDKNAGAEKATKESAAKSKSTITFKNEDFYKADGTFDVEKGKDAIIAVAKYHGYNIFPGFREGLWVSDYGTGKYTELGLAAYMFKNNEKDRYMLGSFLITKPNVA